MKYHKIGYLTTDVVLLLGLSEPKDGNIYIGTSNIAHMKQSHPTTYAKYGSEIDLILSAPDYVGINSKDNSIEYVKEFILNNEYVKVAVRISSGEKYFARSMYVLNRRRVQNFIKNGKLKKT